MEPEYSATAGLFDMLQPSLPPLRIKKRAAPSTPRRVLNSRGPTPPSHRQDNHFGSGVAGLVREVTDDKMLEKMEQKRLQIEHARNASIRAKQLKIGDKICNVRGITDTPPADWPIQRRRECLTWS
jgi:hypothetical protein